MAENKLKLVTHDGSFHTDDVFATAALFMVLESEGKSFDLFRTRESALIANGDYVYDLGGEYDPERNRFDHHQPGGAGKRENGIDYSSFGLVWKKYGEFLAGGKEEALIIDKHLASPIDAADNGINLFESKSDVGPFLFHDVVMLMRPTWREDARGMDDAFLKCVNIAKEVIARSIVHAKDSVLANQEVRKSYESTVDKRIIIFDKNYPYEDLFRSLPEPLFVVYQRPSDGCWTVKAVRLNTIGFENRKSFPAAWAGLKDAELAKASGVEDAIFCHRALFTAVARSKEGAIKLAQIAVES